MVVGIGPDRGYCDRFVHGLIEFSYFGSCLLFS